MIHFFRKIRRDLLANSQFFKYLKYAIGEIVLVVLGILIALYINNQNELRKEQERFDEVLVEVEDELIWNIQNAKMGIEYLVGKDSLISIIVFDGLNRDHLEKDSLYRFREFYGGYSYIIEDKAFRKLISIDKGLSEEQKSINQMLSSLYNTDSIGSLERVSHSSSEVDFKINEDIKEQDWYIDYMMHEHYGEKEIEYYLNDPEHKKNVVEYLWTTLEQHHSYIQIWFQNFLKSYNIVYTYLENENIVHNDSLHFTYNPSDYMHLIGKYKPIEWPSVWNDFFRNDDYLVEIELLNKRYFTKGYKNDSLDSKQEIIPISNTCFIYKKYRAIGYSRARFNQLNQVSGMDFNHGTYRIKFKKIR